MFHCTYKRTDGITCGTTLCSQILCSLEDCYRNIPYGVESMMC